MKRLNVTLAVLLATGLLVIPFTAAAAEKKAEIEPPKKLKAKPYLRKTCIVSDETFGGVMGEPNAITYKDREIKFGGKDCKKDFDKEPAKFIKKLEAAEAKGSKWNVVLG